MYRHFRNEDFEDYLKQHADELRMSPSDKAWANIEKRITKPYRRTTIVASAFLLIASLFSSLHTDTFKIPARLKALLDTDNTETATPSKQGKVVPINSIASSSIKNTKAQQEPIAFSPLAATTTTEDGSDETFTAALLNIHDLSITSEEIALKQPTQELLSVRLQNVMPVAPKPASLNTSPATTPVIAHTKRKSEFELFFTPTVSYRKLSENKSYLRSLPSNSLNYTSFMNVQNVVTHKPAMGLEFGFAYKYKVARAIKLRGGLQFNFNGYDIKAFKNTPEVATITLNNRSSSNAVGTVATLTSYRNFATASDNSSWIKNSYFQVSAPVGVEVKLHSTDKVQFGIAGTVQPTYLLGDRAYLISSDYKNYTQVPWLIRRWNMNTAVETFVGYSTGHLQWQVGPQIRYQLLSSFDTKYPVKENLIDFGLKVGISLNKQ